MHTYEPSCKMTPQGYARASLCPKASGPGRENGYNSDGTTCTFFPLECVSGAEYSSKRGAGLDVELDQKCS